MCLNYKLKVKTGNMHNDYNYIKTYACGKGQKWIWKITS